jgi:hypothetical protein
VYSRDVFYFCEVGAVDKGSDGIFLTGIKLDDALCRHQIDMGGEPCIYTYIKMTSWDSGLPT